MIPANELRIGNYVGAATDENDKTIPCRIASVLRESIYWDYEAKYKTPSPDNHTLCEFVDGIILTPEVLEKCGFEARIIPSYYEGQSGDIFSILLGPAKYRFIFLTKMHQYSASWLVYVTENIEDANKSSQMVATVAYLHQLQNLYFALTGKELTVEL